MILDDEEMEQLRAAIDGGASEASVCRNCGVAPPTPLDTSRRFGWTGAKAAI